MMHLLYKLWHKLMCNTELLRKHDNTHVYLECPECKYRTTGWEVIERLA